MCSKKEGIIRNIRLDNKVTDGVVKARDIKLEDVAVATDHPVKAHKGKIRSFLCVQNVVFVSDTVFTCCSCLLGQQGHVC